MNPASTNATAVSPAEHPIRIAFVLHVMQVAGAEVLVAEIIRRLGHRLDPVVICLDGIGPLGEQMRREGVPVLSLGRRAGIDMKVTTQFARELRARRIEVIHAHQYTPFFYAALARMLVWPRSHLIFTEHGRHYPDIVSAKRRVTNRLVFARMADEITAVCGFSADSLARVDGFDARPIDVIRNGIDLPVPSSLPVSSLRTRLGLDPDRRYVICVARFHPVKDHAMLLRAFATVASTCPDVDLLLAGDGPLRHDLEQQAAALGIAGRVRFLGVRHDVPALLEASDVFTLTSVSEAASLTLLEAMAANRPVVVTGVGGNGEIVRARTEGLLVPRGDAAAEASALIEILDDPSKAVAMGAAGRARVEALYRLDETVRAYGERYTSAAGRLRRN